MEPFFKFHICKAIAENYDFLVSKNTKKYYFNQIQLQVFGEFKLNTYLWCIT